MTTTRPPSDGLSTRRQQPGWWSPPPAASSGCVAWCCWGSSFSSAPCCSCSPGPCRLGRWPAPTPSSAPGFHPSHRCQTDEHHNHRLLSCHSSRLNGTPISRRTTDGYVNATAMCRANGKQWSKYRESDRCQTYLDALAETSEIRMFDLIESRQGQGGGTWVHPQVAVDLARWISAPFAVWMDGWFLESVQQAQPAPLETPLPRLREAEVIALVERSIGLFERLGGLDQRDQLLFKDIVRSNALTASSGLLPGAPTDQELTLGEAWLEVFQQVLPRSQFCAAAPG
ncbi:MAG: KilA-N domain-containing protein [Prochlorococcaceae cyanobacterium]